MVTPSRASTETVKAVPNGVSFWSVICRSPSSSQRSSVRQRQTSPRACVTMKLTASGVANCAAIVRSPSFSRSSSSTTTTKRPARMSSIASSTVANGLSVRVSAVIVTGGIVPASSLSTYFASTSTSRLTPLAAASSESVVSASVCGISATSKPLSSTAATVSETPSTRDRALLDAVAEQLRGRLDPHARAVALRLDRRDRADAVDVALDVVAAERIAGAQRRLEVDAVAERLHAGERLRHDVEREPAVAASTTVRQTPSTETESPSSAVVAALDDEPAAARTTRPSRPRGRAR